MGYQEKILQQINKNGVITARFARENLIPTVYLTRLVAAGKLKRYARGIYVTDDFVEDEWYLFQLQFEVPVFSHHSALYLHNFTDVISVKKEVTVFNGYNIHGFKDELIEVHYTKRSLYEMGITQVNTIIGNSVRVYDIERTLCDIIANRNAVSSEVYSTTLQRYQKHSPKDLQKLTFYAKKLNILAKVQQVMEILYE